WRLLTSGPKKERALMRNSVHYRKTSLAIVILISALTGPWAFSSPLQIVESVPLETTLAVPGIPQTQAVWLEMIRAAHSTLDLEEFYISNKTGEALDPVIQAIEDAAKRGVRVRLLVDKKFYGEYPDTVNEIGKLPGAESRTIDF